MEDRDIREMLDDCESAKDIPRSRGGPGFNDWEKEFLESVVDQFDTEGSLSRKQESVLTRMWEKV